MILIKLPIEVRRSYPELAKIRDWLNINAGKENLEWGWHWDGAIGQGVYIKDESMALIFRLTAGV